MKVLRIKNELNKHRDLSVKSTTSLEVGNGFDPKAWSNPYVDSSTLGVPYMWDGIGYYERWVEQVYNKLNNVT